MFTTPATRADRRRLWFSNASAISSNSFNIVVGNNIILGAINATSVGQIVNSSVIMAGNSSINSTQNTTSLSISGSGFTHLTTTTTVTPLIVQGAASATANLFQVSNSGSGVFSVNSSGVLVGNGAGLSSVTASIGTVISIIDDISAGFNGSTTAFNIKIATVATAPSSAQSLIVVLGGVVQQPVTAYTVAGSVITFTAAPATGDTCFITLLQYVTPSVVPGSAGSNTQLQYNSSGTLAGTSTLNWIDASGLLSLGNSTVNSTINSSALDISGNGIGTIYLGNSSVNTVINASSITTGTFTGNGSGLTSAGVLTKSFSLLSPTAGDSFTLFWTDKAITVAEVVTLISNTAAGAAVNASFYWGTNRTSASNTILSNINTANSSTGIHTTSFTNATPAANSYVWCVINASTANEFHTTIRMA